MTIIYALKDSLSGEYLTKADTLQRLSTTTRTFQRYNKANKIANTVSTYMWLLVKELSYGKRYARVDISSEDFKEKLYSRFWNRRLSVVPVTLQELLSSI